MPSTHSNWVRLTPQPAQPETVIPPAEQRHLLAWDSSREQVTYLSGDGRSFGSAWSFDGVAWHRWQADEIDFGEQPDRPGYYDPNQKGFVVWRFKAKQEEFSAWYRASPKAKKPPPPLYPSAIIVDAEGIRALPPTTGDLPLSLYTGLSMSSRVAALAFDAHRKVAVCMTRFGVWELDGVGRWEKRVDGISALPEKDWLFDAGGVWDAPKKRCFLWAYTDYRYRLFAWDGTALTELPTQGLPPDALDTKLAFGGHARLGVLAHAGPEGLFVLGEKGWKPVPAKNPPPLLEGAALCHDPKRDILILGPGHVPGGPQVQSAFYALRGGEWETQGTPYREPRLPDDLGFCHAGGQWYGLGHRSPRLFRFDGAAAKTSSGAVGWTEVVDKKTADALDLNMVSALPTERALMAVGGKGKVIELEGDHWRAVGKPPRGLGERGFYQVAFEPASGERPERIVLWGGLLGRAQRALNDTFFHENGSWRQGPASPYPSQPRDSNSWTDFILAWDPGLSRLVRFGSTEVATLEGDVWQRHQPSGYKNLVSSGRQIVASDPVTGETLLVDWTGKRLSRFDLKKCQEIGLLERPNANDSFEPSFDPTTRSLFAQNPKDDTEAFRLDLSWAFEKAKAMGPRHLLSVTAGATPTIPSLSAHLYCATDQAVEIWFCDVEGKKATVRAGRAGDKLAINVIAAEKAPAAIAQQEKKKFVSAAKLSNNALALLVARSSRALECGNPKRNYTGALGISRAGGLPSGIGLDRWPKRSGRPMGFLLQIATGEHLARHAAISVFTRIDGVAPAAPADSSVILLTKAEFARKPQTAPPDGVPPLSLCIVAVKPPLFELDELRLHELGALDGELNQAVERFQSKAKMQDFAPSKLGGFPHWIQEPDRAAVAKGYRFLWQFNTEDLDLNRDWPDSDLNGTVYVFVRDDEKDAFAVWQGS